MFEFFLRRPIFASVCSAVILLAGLIAVPTLPIAQYPNVSPPTVTVTAYYTGASADAVEYSVVTPLEQAINGVQGLRYMQSSTDNTGQATITCTFNLGTDLNVAQNDVQSAVNTVVGRLPLAVTQTGVTVAKNSSTFTLVVAMTSDNPAVDDTILSNYIALNIVNRLKRISGIGGVQIFGERKYAMRLWLDPKALADNGLAASDVITALQDQNVQVAAGAIGQAPTSGNQPYQYTVQAIGRLTTPEEFGNLILKSNSSGYYLRVKDVGRVELGAENYLTGTRFNGHVALGIGVQQLSTANALTISHGVLQAMEEIKPQFPAGVHYSVPYNTTDFVQESIKEVAETLLIAIALVVGVIYLFLQDWRVTLIPSITIPISLIGTFALMKLLDFSINTLTLFGLTLATGLVVDDAIVIIENIARYIEEHKMNAFDGALHATREIAGAVFATSFVLLAVFVPAGFLPGTTGELYRQFALTIACSITISLFNALTLTPALSALLLGRSARPRNRFFGAVNSAISATRSAYGRALPKALQWRFVVLGVFVAGLLGTYWLQRHVPTTFVPEEDQGYFIMLVQLPEGSSLDQTTKFEQAVYGVAKQDPDIEQVFTVAGFSFIGIAPNRGIAFALLKPWGQRTAGKDSLQAILGRMNYGLFHLPGGTAFAFNPPAINGLGAFGGFTFEMQDTGGVGLPAMMLSAYKMMGAAAQDPVLSQVFTQFRMDNPQLQVEVDRNKAYALGVRLQDVYNALQVYLGSFYVNDFNYLAQSYRVYIQADAPFRNRVNDFQTIYVKSASGAIMPVTSFVKITPIKGPPYITHYDLFRSIELSGQAGPGYSSGQAITEMQKLAKAIFPKGISYEWTGLALEEIQSGGATLIIFALAIIMVFLVLAAQYESLTDPFIIILAVPLAMFGAIGALMLRGLQSDIFAQVGYVMLIGLASKNAILIVEFANQLQEQGLDPRSAVIKAAETRLRPILMTSFAFILGILPLVFASGAGAEERHSLGTAVLGGMLVSTVLNLFVTPVIYLMVEGRGHRRRTTGKDGGSTGSVEPGTASEAPART
ncbi:MAG TPA: multidrug efflux RND transporter permease subunit [Candidatus Acidoferrales bacterium]|nr:multidrug efflux RND transporter permease subunit [Candidatus Acidoferrales bacterium]